MSVAKPESYPSYVQTGGGSLLHVLGEWRTTLDAMRDAVCLLDARGNIKRCNSAMQGLLQVPFDQIRGQNCWTLIYESRSPPVGTALRYGIAHLDEASSHTTRINNHWYDITITPVFNSRTHHIGAVHVMADITEIRRAHDDLHFYTRQQQELLHAVAVRMTNAEEDLRRRLARELHDRAGQVVTALGINLNYVQTSLPELYADLRERLDEALSETESISDVIRNVMGELRPAVLDDYGLPAALRWYADGVAKRTGMDIDIVDSVCEPRLPQETETALFRIAQEALTNICRHAQASAVTISLNVTPAHVQFTIEDDGRGFDADDIDSFRRRGHWGLLTMRERAEGVHGSCEFRSRLRQGSTVEVEIMREPHHDRQYNFEDLDHSRG